MLASGSTVVVSVQSLDATGGGDITSRLTAELGNSSAIFAVVGINLSVVSFLDSTFETMIAPGLQSAPGSFSGTIALQTQTDLGSSQDVQGIVSTAMTSVCGVAPVQCVVTEAPDLPGQNSQTPGFFASVGQAFNNIGQIAANTTGGVNAAVQSTGKALTVLPWLILGAGVLVVLVLASGRKTNLAAILR